MMGKFRVTTSASIALVLFAIMSIASSPSRADDLDVWKSSGLQLLIQGSPHVNLAYTDSAGKPQVVSLPSLTAAQLDGLPGGLGEAAASPLLRTGYFDALWNAMKDSVCKDVQQRIATLVNRSPNTAYDIQPCVMDSKAYLVATFSTSWDDPQTGQPMTGRRLLLNLTSPLNGVLFWVTSPHTCHHGGPCNPGQPGDPAFMVVFTANIFVTCTPYPTATINTFSLPISCQAQSSIDVDDVIGGDVTAQLQQAATQFATQTLVSAGSVAVTGGASFPEAAAAFVVKGLATLVDGIGAGIALADDQHLRDAVSSWIIGFIGSPTLGTNAKNTTDDFNALFNNLYMAQLGGMRPFLVGIGPNLALDFGLIYPPPARPLLENKVASQNAGSIISPTIAVAEPEVIAGQDLPVTASNFRGTYANTITLAWNKTVLGTPTTILAYGPPPVQIKTGALTFDATGLTPSTVYEFSVHECDGLTCAPPSNQLQTKTEPASAGMVVFWLDTDITHPVGQTSAPPNGGNFTATVHIPPTATPGPHTLYAGIYGRPPASAPITVCQPGGCAASVALVNTSNNTLYPPDSVVVSGGPATLRGSHFVPGGIAVVYVDNMKSQRAGMARIGPAGNFQASFTLPLIEQGQHTLIAVEAKPGTAPPHLQFVVAGVRVYVQAMAQ